MSATSQPVRPKRLALHWRILLGLIAGVAVGVVLNGTAESLWRLAGVFDLAAWRAGTPPSTEALAAGHEPGVLATLFQLAVDATTFVGDLFMRGLRFIAVPIVLFSLILGASSLSDLRKLSRVGGKTIGIYLFTTAVAITVGLMLADIIRPGDFVSPETRNALAASMSDAAAGKIGTATDKIATTSVWTQLLDIVPMNPFQALADGNMLQVVFFALVLGLALTRVPEHLARPVIAASEALTEAVIVMVEVIMAWAPWAVFALIVPVVATMGFDVLLSLAAYCATVILGLGIMIFGVYPGILYVFTRRQMGFRRFFRGIAPAQLLAFSSSSSSATLPVTMECAEERLGVSEDIVSFVLPLGATINMDGTALYQGVAAVFIAQIYDLDLTFVQQLTIVLTATLASVGTAGVPGVGIVMLVIVLQVVGIPTEGIAVILGVDRLLDMCRTTCNVTGDVMVATLIAAGEGTLKSAEDLQALDELEPDA